MKYSEWTDERLNELIADPRKVKSITHRRPKEGITNKQLSSRVAEKSGFQKKDVYEIFKALREVIFEAMLEKKKVKLEDICTFYPSLKKARQGTRLAGGKSAEQMIVPPYYELRMVRNDYMAKFLREMDVTKEDIDNLYEKDQ